MIDGREIRRSIGTFCAVIFSFEVVGMLGFFSEALNDGYEFEYGTSPVSNLIIALAPMDFSILVVPVLTGIFYWLKTRESVPAGHTLIFVIGLVAMGWLGLALMTQLCKTVSNLDGHREPTASMWVANVGVTAVLLWGIAREWRSERESAGL